MSEPTGTKQVGRVETVELLNGDVVELRPLNIKLLKRFMRKFKEMAEFTGTAPKTDEEREAYDDNVTDLLVDMAAICLSKQYAEETAFLHNKEASRDKFEEMIDQDLMIFISEVCGGIPLSGGGEDADVEDLLKEAQTND